MQDPNADTEWNDVLRAKGIIPPKPKEAEITEEQIIDIVERTVQEKINKNYLEDKNIDELDELEDEEEERILAEMRRRRMAELKEMQEKAKFGYVREITAVDYVKEVNQAGEGIWVVLHLYKSGIPLCSLINQYMDTLAVKFPAVKFIKSISTTCVPNYPDKNLPTIFIYYENDLKNQIIGPLAFNGMNFKIDDFEWRLHIFGVLKSNLKRDEQKDFERDSGLDRFENEMIKTIRQGLRKNDDDSDDDY
ncbi:unnamed protein product [Brachionus calyciflorus]|uniref:Phosducin domain-containing protein n=1 Tax=Brachionus calyciflorus TaxID=104777 RepID=A0A813SJJ3_9BILA|nr:unnamed protein product [Brachionus calyciflorus]